MAIVTPFVQVGTYPTRNFATLGPFMCVNNKMLRLKSNDEHLSSPAYRYADRTISSRFKLTTSGKCLNQAWRVVSEDFPDLNSMRISSSEYFRLPAPPSFIELRIVRIVLMPSSVR